MPVESGTLNSEDRIRGDARTPKFQAKIGEAVDKKCEAVFCECSILTSMNAGAQQITTGVQQEMPALSQPEQRSGFGFFFALLQRTRDALRIKVPVGYENETGFHYGIAPVPGDFRYDI
jgi:hypothetical protein